MSVSQATTAPEVIPAPRATSDWLVLTARLVRWNLFQIWRRTMTKVLLGVVVGLFVLYAGALALLVRVIQAQGDLGTIGGTLLRDQLTFPLSVSFAVGYITFMGVVTLCIVVGSLVGGEYGNSTQRLALSRGVGRGQALAAQLAATAALALLVVAGIMVLGILLGITVGPLLGGTAPGLSFGGITELLQFWGAVAFRLFDYSLIALFFATLGRSTAAGVGGALGFIVIESVIVPILRVLILAQEVTTAIATNGQPTLKLNSVGQTLTIVMNSFLQPNADALAKAAQVGPLNLTPITGTEQIQNLLTLPPGTLQAFLVMLVYAVLAIGGSYLLVRSRDVTD